MHCSARRESTITSTRWVHTLHTDVVCVTWWRKKLYKLFLPRDCPLTEDLSFLISLPICALLDQYNISVYFCRHYMWDTWNFLHLPYCSDTPLLSLWVSKKNKWKHETYNKCHKTSLDWKDVKMLNTNHADTRSHPLSGLSYGCSQWLFSLPIKLAMHWFYTYKCFHEEYNSACEHSCHQVISEPIGYLTTI